MYKGERLRNSYWLLPNIWRSHTQKKILFSKQTNLTFFGKTIFNQHNFFGQFYRKEKRFYDDRWNFLYPPSKLKKKHKKKATFFSRKPHFSWSKIVFCKKHFFLFVKNGGFSKKKVAFLCVFFTLGVIKKHFPGKKTKHCYYSYWFFSIN